MKVVASGGNSFVANARATVLTYMSVHWRLHTRRQRDVTSRCQDFRRAFPKEMSVSATFTSSDTPSISISSDRTDRISTQDAMRLTTALFARSVWKGRRNQISGPYEDADTIEQDLTSFRMA